MYFKVKIIIPLQTLIQQLKVIAERCRSNLDKNYLIRINWFPAVQVLDSGVSDRKEEKLSPFISVFRDHPPDSPFYAGYM